jgi:hypothetical protein
MRRNRLTARLFELRPPGFQIEAREHEGGTWTEYRYTRLADGLWAQQAVAWEAIEQTVSIDGLARAVLAQVLRKFDQWDRRD